MTFKSICQAYFYIIKMNFCSILAHADVIQKPHLEII